MATSTRGKILGSVMKMFDEMNDYLPAGTTVVINVAMKNEHGTFSEPQRFETVTVQREEVSQP